MNYVKISVTLEPKVAEELRLVAGHRRQSAFVNEALRQHLQARRLRTWLREAEAEAGPIPEEIQREVDGLDWPD